MVVKVAVKVSRGKGRREGHDGMGVEKPLGPPAVS